ncbi:MAG TPA: HD domain-containing protein [Fimbriimonadaceae bacterium]|nr:HD domain-containing protein [Fimbriimonadaceae bacterium]HRJ95615.1 HD domain-containing protein [Fimbriimonadaceae bacterium]
MTHITDRLTDSIRYAMEIHHGARKGTDIPYMSHLLAVLAIVLEHGGDEDEAVAAVLHDAGEDAGGQERIDDIRARFGDRVADIVLGCSDTLAEPKPAWRARKEAYLAHLPEADRSTILVSAADKLHNLRAIEQDYRQLGDDLWARFKGGKDGTLWYYLELSHIYRERMPGPLAEEVMRVAFRLYDLSFTNGLPRPDRSNAKIPNRVKTPENDSIDFGWDEGILSDGRPWRAEAWAKDQLTCITFFFPLRGLETLDRDDFIQLLERENLLTYADERRFVTPMPAVDVSGHPLWGVHVVVADESDTYVEDHLSLKPYPGRPTDS